MTASEERSARSCDSEFHGGCDCNAAEISELRAERDEARAETKDLRRIIREALEIIEANVPGLRR